MGTYEGIANPLLLITPGNTTTDAKLELYCKDTGGVFVLNNNNEIIVGPSLPSGNTMFEEMQAELDSKYEFASGNGIQSNGWSELAQPPVDYTIIS